MGKPYSDDLRRGIVLSIEAGHTYEEAAELSGVSVSSVSRLLTRWRNTGSVSPGKFGGYKGYDRDRGTPHDAAPPTPPGIRFTYLGGSTGLSFNAQCRCEAGRESRKRDCAVPSEVPGVLTYARSPSANRRQPRQGISQRLYGAIP